MDTNNTTKPIEWPMNFEDPRRVVLPIIVERASPYRVVNGKIHSEACELSITEHCNFTCRSCSHLSPITSKHKLDPKTVETDLSLLARHYQVDHVRLVGGEPFLHPQLSDIITAVRCSGITKRIRIITNGSFPQRITPKVWAETDEIHFSIYPGKEPPTSVLERLKEQAIEYNTELVIKRFEKFRESYSEIGTTEDLLVKRIYQSCQIAHIWRCHTVRNGFFYRCPQSIFIPSVAGSSEPHLEDKLAITDDTLFGAKLLAFLEQPTPLKACRNCLGSVGKIFDHSQISRSHWRKLQMFCTEEMIDYDFLTKLEEIDPDYDNDCWITEM